MCGSKHGEMIALWVTTLLVSSQLLCHVTQSVAYRNPLSGSLNAKFNNDNNRLFQHERDVSSDRNSRSLSSKDKGLIVDLRAHKLFMSNPLLDCCPTVTQLNRRSVGINPHGLVLELFQTENFTQAFYETLCHPTLKDHPCQFIDLSLASFSRCAQQWSYVYAMGRTFGHFYEQFRFDYIRVATGCKCQLPAKVVREPGAKGQRQSLVLLQPSLDGTVP